MSEDALIRYDNLEAFVKARNWGPTDLAVATGRKKNQCSDMLRRKKPFGEKIARDFEHRLGLPRGWFDQIHEQDDQHIATAAYRIAKEISAALTPLRVEEQHFGQVPHAAVVTRPESPDISWLRAPVVAWARLGDDLLRANDEWPAGEMVRCAATQPPAGHRYKAVEVPDEALGPRIARGDVVIIDPDQRTPKRNQVVLVQALDGTFMLRRYMPVREPGMFELIDASGRSLDAARYGLSIAGTAIALVPHDL
jgi:hypothetical protein